MSEVATLGLSWFEQTHAHLHAFYGNLPKHVSLIPAPVGPLATIKPEMTHARTKPCTHWHTYIDYTRPSKPVRASLQLWEAPGQRDWARVGRCHKNSFTDAGALQSIR